MPYITSVSRESLDYEVDALIVALGRNGWVEGEINYSFYRILLAWWQSRSKYNTICKIMGTLSCISQEFYRKVAAKYEDQAIIKNGDVTWLFAKECR